MRGLTVESLVKGGVLRVGVEGWGCNAREFMMD
jgi:hypothetical protein